MRSWSIALDIFIASFSSLVEEDSNDDLHGIYLTGRREYSVGVTDFYGQRIYPDGSRLVGAFESGTGRFRAGARYFHNGGDEVDKTVLQLREPQFTHGRCAICGSVNPGCAHYSVPIRPHDCKTDLFARDLMGFSTNGIAILREKEALLEIEAKGQAVSDVACSWRSRGAAVYSDARAMLLDGLRNVVCGAPYLHFEKLSKNSAYLRIDIICRHLRKTVRSVHVTCPRACGGDCYALRHHFTHYLHPSMPWRASLCPALSCPALFLSEVLQVLHG